MVLFMIFGVILICSALGVVLARNPINSALCLIGNMVTIAGLFASLEAHFLAAVQIIVYAGAIMVLVLFVLMLLSSKAESQTKRSPLLVALAICGSFFFLTFLIPILRESFATFPTHSHQLSGTMDQLGLVLYREYVFTFEASSILLMTAIAGVVLLTRRKV